jgi:hypothetical protein
MATGTLPRLPANTPAFRHPILFIVNCLAVDGDVNADPDGEDETCEPARSRQWIFDQMNATH